MVEVVQNWLPVIVSVAIILVSFWVGWLRKLFMVFTTVVHELGHSSLAWLGGAGFNPIKINSLSDTLRTGAHGSSHWKAGSRITYPGLILAVLAGYGMPIVVGVWFQIAWYFDLFTPVAVTLIVIVVLLLLYGRTLYSFGYSLLLGVMFVIPVLAWFVLKEPVVLSYYTIILSNILLFYGFFSLLKIIQQVFVQPFGSVTKQPQGTDDFSSLSKMFKFTTTKFWVVVEVGLLCGCFVIFGVIIRLVLG